MVSLSLNTSLKNQTIGQMTLTVCAPETITSIMPFRGQQGVVAKLLKAPMETQVIARKKALTIQWMGQNQWFVRGKFDSQKIASLAATTDQSAAWQIFTLTGVGASAVMARLTPLDLSMLTKTHIARSELAHMPAAISPIADGYEILVLRSFAKTAVVEIEGAMARVSFSG